MSVDSGPSPAELREDIELIKDAMGLGERYPSHLQLWLVYGPLVLAASIASQVVVLRGLPGYYHPIAWFVFMGAGGLYAWWSGPAESETGTETGPNIFLQWAAVFLLYFVFLAAGSPLFQDGTGPVGTIVIFSFIVGLVGTSYLVMSESLKAYRIQGRDRRVIAAAGIWMLVLAAVMPNVPALRTWGYTVFGVLFAVYAVGAYLVLSR